MSRFGRAFIVLVIISLAAVNALACRRHCASDASHRNTSPFLTDDHSLHFANALATRNFLHESGTNAGYDPFFMSGYAKSSLWPTNALLELVMFLTPMLDPAAVFKTFVWLSAAAMPLTLIYAGWRLGLSSVVVMLAIVFWMMQYWSSQPFHTYQFIQFGMSAFVWSVTLSLAAGVSIEHWLRKRTTASAIEMGFVSGLAVMAHPTTAFLVGVPTLFSFIFQPDARTKRSAGQAILAAALAAGVNYWWIAPLVTLRGTWGGSPAFFKNPNVLQRLGDLFRPDDSASLLVAPALIGVLLILTAFNGRRLGLVFPLTVIWIFLLAFPAGAIEQLAFLQVGRNTLQLSAWLCLPAAAVISGILSSWPSLVRIPTVLGVGWCLLCGAATPVKKLTEVFTRNLHATTAEMFPKHAAVLDELRAAAPNTRRVLFEVFEDRFPEMAGAKNPYGSIRLSPLIPLETGLEAVGGPYWATHYSTNFTNCGEGFFVGGKRWNRKEAVEYFRIYELDLAVLWSRPALGFAETNGDLFELVKDLRGVKIFRIRREKSLWDSEGLKLFATYNKIVVENPRLARGRFVLPYHATPGWSIDPACELASTFQGADPVPFLTVVDPPEKVTLRFSPWTLSGPPPSR